MSVRAILPLSLSFCLPYLLDAQLNAPKAGVVRYSDGTLHAVYGLPANYVIDHQALASAEAVSFSDNGGLIAKDGNILLVDGGLKKIAEFQAGESAPVLNIDNALDSAVAWLPHQQAVLHWTGSFFVLTQVNGIQSLGSVVSLHLTGGNAAKLLLNTIANSDAEATVSLDSGEVTSLDALPGVRGAAIRQQTFVVFRDDRGLAIATPSAVAQSFPLPDLKPGSELSFERMSADSLHVIAAGTSTSWVLHFGNTAGPRLSQLPSLPASLPNSLSEAKQ